MQHLIKAESCASELAVNLNTFCVIFDSLKSDIKHGSQIRQTYDETYELLNNDVVSQVQSLSIDLIGWIHQLEKSPVLSPPAGSYPSTSLESLKEKAEKLDENVQLLMNSFLLLDDNKKRRSESRFTEAFDLLQNKIIPQCQKVTMHIIDSLNDDSVVDENEIEQLLEENNL